MKQSILLLIIFVFTGCGGAEKTTTQADETQMPLGLPENFGSKFDPDFSFDTEKMTEYLSLINKNDKWQGSVAIVHDGKPMYLKAFGKLSESSNRNADGGTRYRIGSISKTYLSTIIHQLAAKGKLSLSTKLSKYYPKMPNAKAITIEQMLRHETGLANYIEAEGFDLLKDQTQQEILSFIEDLKPTGKPGQRFEYSNTNYFLLAKIIEQETGKTYREAVQQLILAPRRFVATKIADNEVLPNQNEASSFVFNYDTNTWTQVPAWSINNATGAGDISATAADVASFFHDLMNGKIVEPRQVSKLVDTDSKGQGKGIFEIPFYDRTSYGHTGGLEGYRSVAGFFPEENISFAILSNGVNMDHNDVAIGVLSILFGKKYRLPLFGEAALNMVEKIDAYIGEFETEEFPLDISIFDIDGQLFGRATGQSQFPLSQMEDGSFEFEPANITVTFDDLKDGKYQGFTFFQGREFYFNRKE